MMVEKTWEKCNQCTPCDGYTFKWPKFTILSINLGEMQINWARTTILFVMVILSKVQSVLKIVSCLAKLMKINSNLFMNGMICNVNLVCDYLSTNYWLWKQWRKKGLSWLIGRERWEVKAFTSGREVGGEGSAFELCKNERGGVVVSFFFDKT